MNWKDLLSDKRLKEQTKPRGGDERKAFHQDYDRLIFSSAFRRLGRKTQVHPLAKNDHLHTRLSHSLEVSCVGRSLGTRVGQKIQKYLPEGLHADDLGLIVQSACLAHDIGNPPFGHAGEDAIRDWFAHPQHQHYLQPLTEAQRDDIQTFEGNAQGFRVVTQLEHYRNNGGMRLTYATLGSMLKYPWTAQHAMQNKRSPKFSCYQAEKTILTEVANTLGLIQRDAACWCRHPLSFLMEAADDICYAILDLEDGVEIELIAFDEFKEKIYPLIIEDKKHDVEQWLKVEENAALSDRRKMGKLRALAINHCTDIVAEIFLKHHDDILNGNFPHDNLLALHDTAIGEEIKGAKAICEGIKAAKAFAHKKIFKHHRQLELELGAFSCLHALLDAFCGAVYQRHSNEQLSERQQKILKLMYYTRPEPYAPPPLYQSYLDIFDFIGGMTDNYAAYMAQQISGISR